MITRDQAFSAEEFHVAHSGLPCEVWHKSGNVTHDLDGDGFIVFVYRNEPNGDLSPLRRDSETQWHHITGVNAADFHVADECPHRRMSDDRPPIGSDRSEGQLVLSSGPRDANGYDADGYDADGFDRNGYDMAGFDEDGYDADGYDRNGDDRDGINRDAPEAGDLDLADLWSEFNSGRWTYTRQDDFRHHLRTMVRDPDAIDDLSFCGNCAEPAWDDDLRRAGTWESICGSCWDDWTYCDSCEERFPSDDLHEMLSGSEVCDSCRSSYYTYCDDCHGYYNDNDADEHNHSSGDGCCESPQMEFRIRNDGQEPLKNDTRITITLPTGVIDAEGMQAIARCLRRYGQYDVSYGLDQIGPQWQGKTGNFTKRLSRHAYQKCQAKLPPDLISAVGNIAREHSNAVDVTIDVTRDLNQDAGYFYHEDSCWWGSYSESRCAAKTNGVLGLRSLDSYGGCTGRAWVMPLRLDENGHLVPTFETMTPDAFVVFNGYGDLNGYTPARIIAHMAGWTYRKISFDASPMYVNAGGYLVAPEHIAEPYTDGHLSLSIRQHSSLYETERQFCHA